MAAQKARYSDPQQRRLYPLATFNSWCAQGLAALLAPVLTPNAVSLLSLLTSLAGAVLVFTAQWHLMVWGAGLVHLGLLLDHADGQVARRRGMGSTWGMYLDMVIDRVVEIALVLSLVPAIRQGVAGGPSSWSAPSAGWIELAAAGLVGVMMLWRFLTAYNDVLYMRDHLLGTGRLPDPEARPSGLLKRPLVPFVFNRDWVLAIWLVGVLLGQIHALVLLLLALHLLACAEKIIVFKARHKKPEGDARRVLGKDYH